jgi:NAD(P)-dependent dehydrogenase (short-subunit alcohol dehydrogenase family)
MRKERKFAFGVAAGAAAVLAGRQVARSRHAIDFRGRTVVITGGSRGLGLVMARQFAAEGARLCLMARDASELERARRQLIDRGANDVLIVPCDVRARDQVAQAIDAILAERAAIDVLINNAGVIQVGPLEHMTTTDFENAMATHFWGPLHLMQACVPAMRRRGFGRIVNVASVGGRVAVPHLAPYSASKFALVGLSDAVRAEVARHGIRVTTVSPGLMRTGSPVNAQFKGRHDAEFAWFAIADAIPGVSMSAERAARQVLDACRYGDAELIVGAPAKAAVLAAALAPALVARVMATVSRLLPGRSDAGGNAIRSGKDSRSRWAPSVLTTLNDRAAAANNQA